MKRILIPAAAILIAIGFTAWWFSPAQALKRRTHNLLGTLTVESNTSKASRNLKTYALNRMLAENVELSTPTIDESNGEFERSELESGFSWLANRARQMHFKSSRIHSVKIDGDHARVELEIDSLVELPSHRPVDGLFDVIFEWRQEEDGWRLFRATWTEK